MMLTNLTYRAAEVDESFAKSQPSWLLDGCFLGLELYDILGVHRLRGIIC